MDNLKATLRTKGLRPTFQRLAILDLLTRSEGHPTVDDLYKAVYKMIPTMSKTTVYNTLWALAEGGLVSTVQISPQETRFELAQSHHHHFMCKRCGAILDLNHKCPIFECGEVDGNAVTEWHGYFIGICSGCKKDQGKRPRSENNNRVSHNRRKSS